MILAAGLGTRLNPYTDLVPKPLVPVVDKTILEHQVDAVQRLRASIPVTRILANAHHLAEQIEAAAGALGIDHVFVEQPNILGTGGPLQRVWAEGWHGELLVMNSDAYHNFDLAAFVLAARKSKDSFALLCVEYPPAHNLQCNAQGRICGRDGKYSMSSFVCKTAFSGVSWYSPAALSRIAADDFNVVDFWMREAQEGRLPLAYMEQRFATWIDMGSPAGLYRACEARMAELGKDRWVDVLVDATQSQVGQGTVVSRGAILGAGSRLQRCLVLPNAHIAAGQLMENCIVGENFQWPL